MADKRIIRLWNRAHMGDIIILFHFLRKSVILNREIEFELYVRPALVATMATYRPTGVTLLPDTIRPFDAHDTWIGRDDPWIVSDYKMGYEFYYLNWFKRFCIKVDIQCPFKVVDDLLFDDPRILTALPHESVIPRDFEVLLVNCKPLSGQSDWSDSAIHQMATHFESRGHPVQPLQPLPGFRTSTVDRGIDLFGIAALATLAKVVVGVMTGPLHPCLNVWAIKSVKRWVIIDRLTGYAYGPTIQVVRSMDEAVTACQQVNLS